VPYGYATGLTGRLLLTVSTTTPNLGLEFFRSDAIVALGVRRALGVAAHAGCGLGHLHAIVRHARDTLEAVRVGHAGLWSGEMAHTVHASTHGLAHRVISASTLGHGKFGPLSWAAELEVHSALGLSRDPGTVSVRGARLHISSVGGHDGGHHVFSRRLGVHIGDSHSDKDCENKEALHDDVWCLRITEEISEFVKGYKTEQLEESLERDDVRRSRPVKPVA